MSTDQQEDSDMSVDMLKQKLRMILRTPPAPMAHHIDRVPFDQVDLIADALLDAIQQHKEDDTMD